MGGGRTAAAGGKPMRGSSTHVRARFGRPPRSAAASPAPRRRAGAGDGRNADLTPHCASAIAQGCDRAEVIPAANVATAAWVRFKCRWGCPGYGGTLMCPPHSPTPAETAEVVRCYRRAILLHAADHRPVKKAAVALERELFLAGYYKAYAMGSGPCRLCAACAFDEGCRHPYLARPAMEACGVDVFETARRSGFPIRVVRTHADRQDYFALVLVD